MNSEGALQLVQAEVWCCLKHLLHAKYMELDMPVSVHTGLLQYEMGIRTFEFNAATHHWKCCGMTGRLFTDLVALLCGLKWRMKFCRIPLASAQD